ncbi:hypothetical protein BGY98DRAFT_991520, partial [Russula aff. rugulosa BPL654]
MPRKKRATRASIQNLSQARRKKNKPINIYVLDGPDTLDTDNAMPNNNGDDSEGSSSSIEILDGDRDTDICEETELAKFSRILRDAQKRAMEEEKAKGKKRKTYNGRSQKTAYRWKRVQRDHASKGFLPVDAFMKHTALQKNADKPTGGITAPQNLPVEELEESFGDDAASAFRLWSNRSCISEDTVTEIERLAPAASEGPALIEEHRWVTQGSTASEACEEHRRVVQGPTASDHRRRVTQCLREEEEESTGSEDEDKDKQNEHMGAAPFEDAWRRVLMGSAFYEHWRKEHLKAGKAPGEDTNETYDPRDFVKSICDGTPVEGRHSMDSQRSKKVLEDWASRMWGRMCWAAILYC